jgi:phage N-6-adenine-methyltransferase
VGVIVGDDGVAVTKRQSMVAAALTSGAASDDESGAHWRTPPALVARCAGLVHVPWDLDAAALAGSAVTGEYLGPDHTDPGRRDALSVPWPGRNVWLNPPYSRNMKAWVSKAAAEVGREGGPDVIALLVFARTDTAWWSILWEAAAEVHFFRGRVSFLHPTTGEPVAPAPAPSALVVLRRDELPWDPACSVVDQTDPLDLGGRA